MPLVVEPVPAPLAAMLRRAVLNLRTEETRRVFGPVVHVGVPGRAASHGVRHDQPMDQALRADVVAALLRRADLASGSPLMWVTRTGGHTLHDVDAAWLAAARQAYAEAGVPFTMVVVTRQGWWDPRSSTQRVWKRLRPPR